MHLLVPSFTEVNPPTLEYGMGLCGIKRDLAAGTHVGDRAAGTDSNPPRLQSAASIVLGRNHPKQMKNCSWYPT